MSRISIIIPVFNEEKNISKVLNHIFKNTSKENISDIIIVDGGSTDQSQDIVKTFDFVKLIDSEKGRAKQMNLGAKQAKGDILYFLHVDSFPPKYFDKLIIEEVSKGNNSGCFIMKFNSNHLWLKLAGWLTKLPYKFCRGGDQSLFVTKSLFNELGGYNEEFVIYEDNDFISKLYKLNQFVVIKKWLTTSSRRYKKNGVFILQWHFLSIHLKKFFGASADELYAYYIKHIK